jgi:hypothetical protein
MYRDSIMVEGTKLPRKIGRDLYSIAIPHAAQPH